MQRFYLLILFFALPLTFVSQDLPLDSILSHADDLLYEDTDKSIELCNQVLHSSPNQIQEFNANYTLGDCYYLKGNFEISLDHYYKCQRTAENLKDEFLLSKSFLGQGTVYDDNGDSGKGLSLYFKALEIRERLGNKENISSVLNNIAVTYYKEDKLNEAITYMAKCVKIDRELNDSVGLGYSYSNLGAFYYFNDQIDSALYCHNLALKIRTNLGQDFQIARSLNNIANVYEEEGETDLAIDYYRKAIEIKRTLNNPYELAKIVSNLGITLSNHNRPEGALISLLEAASILDTLDNPTMMKDNMVALASTYAQLNKMDSAYTVMERAYRLSKKIYSESKSEQIEEMVAKYETEKTEKENEELKAQKAISALENEELKSQRTEDALAMEKSKNRNYLLIGSLLILILIAGIILTRLRANRRTTDILQGLNYQLEEKNSDITDSIQYAKRIQQALLPSKQDIANSFNEAFILFKPRDIVSGDFYWIHEQDEKVFFAVADCTGHGVPGAFVSVLCNNLLGHAVSEHGFTSPGKILEDVNKGIKKRLRKENAKITMMDGMDISLCVLDRNTLELQFSGAMNPVLIYSETEMTEYKGTKEAIGGLDHGKEFKTITHQLKKGDMIYLFSDGYQDQFGGEKGKKFKYKNLKKQLLSICQKDLKSQHNILEKLHLDWRADVEQLDDICLMGVRV